MTNSVHAVTEGVLRKRLGLIFGSHPTFQFLIFDLAKRLRPDDYLSAIRMYVSRFFVTEAAVEELSQNAEVIAIDEIRGDRDKSLTAMRRSMLGDSGAGGLVAIGGKTARGSHRPGIDEEIQLAQSAGLPVFILGSVGGRSSELCATMTPGERAAMNGLSEKDNIELATSLDYSRLTQLILDHASELFSTSYGRIISLFSCSKMWQCQT